jgi:hypothetical protein
MEEGTTELRLGTVDLGRGTGDPLSGSGNDAPLAIDDVAGLGAQPCCPDVERCLSYVQALVSVVLRLFADVRRRFAGIGETLTPGGSIELLTNDLANMLVRYEQRLIR